MRTADAEQLQDELRLLRRVVETTSDAYLHGDADGTVVGGNRAAEELFGWSRSELVGRPLSELLHAGDRDGGRLFDDGGSERETMAVARTRQGHRRQVAATLWEEERDGRRTVHALLRDVSDRRRSDEGLARQAVRLTEAQRIAGIGDWEWDRTSGELSWSTHAYDIHGDDPGTVVTYASHLDRLHPEDRDSVRALFEAVQAGQPLEYEARIVQPDGEIRWIHVLGETAATGTDGRPTRLAGTVQDITERKRSESELEQLAFSDSLTGLANRDRFVDRLGDALEARTDAPKSGVGLLLFDLDGFKDVNDGIGHHAGDLVLQGVARRVAAVVRGGDTLARLGGDEFAVVLPGIDGIEDAIAVADKIGRAFEPAFDLEGIPVHVGASVGIVASPLDGDDVDTLLRKADAAMYRAKSGSSGWAVYESAQDDVAADRLLLVDDLRRAIEEGALEVAYQPIVETRTRRISGLEALVRWHHPERGAVPPDQFVPLAEQAHLIGPLTELVLRRAVRACVRWRDAGHDVSVGVNVSVPAMQTSGLVGMTSAILAETGLPARHLVFELSETAVAMGAEGIQAVLAELAGLGVAIVIDDFGTGYSAMSYLKELPVRELKIDRSFIRDVTTDDRALSVVRSLVRLAHSLSLRVVAEGAASLPSVEVLAGVGCDFVQGYAIARPMPEDAVATWLRQHDRDRPADHEGRPHHVLVVDDSPVVRSYLTTLLTEAGWEVREAASAEDAIIEVERRLPDVIVLDHQLPMGMTGVDAVPRFRARGFDGPILLFTQFLTEVLPKLRVPLDVWPVSKASPEAVLELLDAHRSGAP